MRHRAFIFSIDATLAVFVLVATLIAMAYLSAQAEADPFVKVQTVRTAKDALYVLERQGTLETANRTLIESALSSALPGNIGARLEIETYYYDSGAFYLSNISEYGDALPSDQALYGARQDFVAMKNGQITNYSIARMTIWQK